MNFAQKIRQNCILRLNVKVYICLFTIITSDQYLIGYQITIVRSLETFVLTVVYNEINYYPIIKKIEHIFVWQFLSQLGLFVRRWTGGAII